MRPGEIVAMVLVFVILAVWGLQLDCRFFEWQERRKADRELRR